jgi:uncharacterized damage-inducible protein DinB
MAATARLLKMQYDPEFIRHLFDYMIACDRTMFDAAQKIPDAEYYKPREISAGSIHNVFVHQMVAQNTWLSRWKGIVLTGRLENQIEYPTRELLAERWPVVHQSLLEFLEQQSAHSLNAPLTVRRNNGELITQPLGAMMMHVADHGTYHRGQLNTMFKQAGVEPAYTPYFRFAAEQAEKKS